MNIEFIDTWRRSSLFQGFLSGSQSPYAAASNQRQGPGIMGALGKDAKLFSPTGPAYQLSLSPMARQWSIRNLTPGLSEDERKAIVAMLAAEEEASAAQESETSHSAAQPKLETAVYQPYSRHASKPGGNPIATPPPPILTEETEGTEDTEDTDTAEENEDTGEAESSEEPVNTENPESNEGPVNTENTEPGEEPVNTENTETPDDPVNPEVIDENPDPENTIPDPEANGGEEVVDQPENDPNPT